MDEVEYMDLCSFLEQFRLDQMVRFVEEDQVLYEGVLADLPFRIINMAYIEKKSVYLDHSVVVIPIQYENNLDLEITTD